MQAMKPDIPEMHVNLFHKPKTTKPGYLIPHAPVLGKMCGDSHLRCEGRLHHKTV